MKVGENEMNDYTAAVQAFFAVNLDHTPRPVSSTPRSAPGEDEPVRAEGQYDRHREQ